eukprot:SM000052S17693  [mRNA]  locus=s52:115343:116412:+ [translate_table: standard]
MASFKALESLSIIHSYAADTMSSPVTYPDIEVFATCCQHLTELRLSCAGGAVDTITDSGLQSLATRLPKLHTFHVANNKLITDFGIEQLAIRCSLLQDSVHAIGMGCIGLRRLRCERSWGDRWLDNASLHFSHLEMLHLSIPYDRGEGALTTMATLASSCPRLHELYLDATSVFVIRPDDVVRPDLLEIGPSTFPSTLPLVKLTLCRFHIDAASFLNVLTNFPVLKTLSLWSCELVGAMGELSAKLSLCSLEYHHLTGQYHGQKRSRVQNSESVHLSSGLHRHVVRSKC